MTPPASDAAALRATHRTVNLLAIAAFLGGAALRICDGLLPRLARDFQVTAGVAGQVVITFSIAYGVMQLVFGPLGDRFGKARMVCIAVFGCAALALVAALAPGFPTLLAARVGWGMAAAGVIPLAMAWIGDAVPIEERQPTLARLLTGTLSGIMAGQLVGGLFGDSAFGWRGAFVTMAAGYAVVGALLLARLRAISAASSPAPADPVPVHRQWRLVLSSPWSWKVLGAAAAEGAFLLGPMAYLPAMLHQRFGLSLSAASGMLALYAVGGLVYAMSARMLVRRMGQERMVLAGGWLMGLGYLGWLASPVVWTAAPVALLVGFGTYLYHNTLQTHATQMAPSARGTSVSLFAFCLFTGQALGVTLAGGAFDRFGPLAVLTASALALPAAGIAFARALRTRLREQPQP
ncbi:MAG TPA: MFS transporter [Ramlibacter sp.]|jgi:predicted MFS family arabinose efflux permease|uniref:MFS transporter n=1 Tax=Ramlibacter sp. TaxID=1917967 RepID=UPI002D4012A2|nr:MFS transporter [Ramlibacter sp.]HZY19081.1 MFS transporter [Ramlibacter sp.]